MKPRASVVALLTVAFALALVLLRPQPSTTVADDGVESTPLPAAAAKPHRAAIDAAPIAAAPEPFAPAPAEALAPTPSAAPLSAPESKSPNARRTDP